MTHTARYAIARFMPYAETQEFANVGIVMLSPSARYFNFQLSNKWRRIGAFFDTLSRPVFAQGMAAFSEELTRTRDMALPWLEAGTQQQEGVQRIFDDLVRPREALFQFSSVRAVMAASPHDKLAELFDRYVDHDLATPEYQEQLLEKAVRSVLRREGLGTRFHRAKLGVGTLQFSVPFAELDDSGQALRVIKPLHLAYDDSLRILDHGNQWLGRLRHLERVKALPKSLLLSVTEPPEGTERFGTFEEVRRELTNLGAVFAAANDEQALIRFAQAA